MSKKDKDKYIRGEHINNKYEEIVIYTFFGGVGMAMVRCMTERKDLAQFQPGTQAQWSKRASVFAHSL